MHGLCARTSSGTSKINVLFVCGILRCAKLPRSNLTKEQRTALKELRGIEDEVILPADKGNATVMMRR